MFAIVLKNTILIFLIICIAYFLVDNHLNEIDNEKTYNLVKKNNEKTEKESKNSVKEFLKKINNDIDDSDEDEEKEISSKKSTEVFNEKTNKMKIQLDPDMKELYNYVFNDVNANTDLENMYNSTIVTDVKKDSQILCENDEDKKYDEMCKDPIKEHHDEVSYDLIQSKPISDQSDFDFVENKASTDNN